MKKEEETLYQSLSADSHPPFACHSNTVLQKSNVFSQTLTLSAAKLGLCLRLWSETAAKDSAELASNQKNNKKIQQKKQTNMIFCFKRCSFLTNLRRNICRILGEELLCLYVRKLVKISHLEITSASLQTFPVKIGLKMGPNNPLIN